MTPNEAAKRTGKSRRSIMRAIEAHDIKAWRDNRNQWQIDEEALAQWARNEQPIHIAHIAHPAQSHDMGAEVAVLRELLETMRTANDDLRTDRDRWHALAIRPWWRQLAG